MLLKSRKPIFFRFFPKKVYLPRCKRRGEGTEKVSNFWEDLGYHHFEVGFKLESHINRMFGERKRPFSRKVLLASLHFFIFFFNPFLSFLSFLFHVILIFLSTIHALYFSFQQFMFPFLVQNSFKQFCFAKLNFFAAFLLRNSFRRNREDPTLLKAYRRPNGMKLVSYHATWVNSFYCIKNI